MSFSRYNSGYGHYTQVVWAETEELGCGMVYYKEDSAQYQYQTIVVCNYAKGGNFKDAEMYATGTACSACPNGYTCDDGLCSKAWLILLQCKYEIFLIFVLN